MGGGGDEKVPERLVCAVWTLGDSFLFFLSLIFFTLTNVLFAYIELKLQNKSDWMQQQ